MTLTESEYENMSGAVVNAMLAKGPALGPWLATLEHLSRATAVAALYEALGFSETVYTALLFRPARVIMCELDEATFTRTFIADPNDGVYVDDKTVFGL